MRIDPVNMTLVIIIHGAAGGVGSLALQFAKLRGARLLATASGEDGLALVRRLGADTAVDGRQGNIKAAARCFAPNGVDAVLALAGGKELPTASTGSEGAADSRIPTGSSPSRGSDAA
jgi:NADPH2:quinone reductase